MLYRNHKTNKALRILALLLALICIFTIADPAVYAMGQEENEGQQTEQVQEDKQEQDSNAGGGTEQTGGDNGPDKNTNGDNGNGDPDKDDGDNGSGDPDKDDGDNGNGDPDKDADNNGSGAPDKDADNNGDADTNKGGDSNGDADTNKDADNNGGNDAPNKGDDKNTDDNSGANPDKQPDDNSGAVPGKEPGEEDEPEPDEKDLAEEEDGVNENAAASVELFLAVNGVWKNVGTRSVNLDASTKRYYITAAEMAEVYKTRGITIGEVNGTQRIFPHTDKKNYDTIWADAKPYQTESGEWRVPLSTNIDNYLYYLPNNVEGKASYFVNNKARDDSAVLADNTFYTVSVSDTTGTEDTATGIYYVFTGKEFSITLSQHDEHEWRITNPDTGDTIKPDETAQQDYGKVKYTFKAVTCPIKIMLADESKTTYTIHYNAATLDATKEQLGQIAAANQTVLQDGCIDGQAELEVTLSLGEGDEYMLRRPDEEQLTVLVSGDKGKKFIYFFDGWRVSSGEIIPADTILTAANILRYEENGALTLNAVWKAKDANGRISTVNFYVNLYCEIANNLTDGVTDVPQDNFTHSIHYTGIFGTENIAGGSNLDCMPIAPVKGQNAYKADAQLRELAVTTDANGLRLESLPSDEDVLRQIRNSGTTIKVEGVAIPSTRLTTDHFKVRWYVLKYDKGDGWHVDGVLVAKEGYLRVRKTFIGDSAAIKQVTENFEIKVDHKPLSGGTETDYDLTLVPAADETRTGKVGYTSYDAATNTYEWVLKGNAADEYEFIESNYTLEDSSWHSSSWYIISGTGADAGSAAAGTSVATRMESYATDVPKTSYKTVTFSNSYVHAGMLTLYKEDSFTHKGMSGVEFTLVGKDGKIPLYRNSNTGYYTTDENADAGSYTAADALVTDVHGRAYITLPAGEYILTEENVPSGYLGAEKIRFAVDANGTLTELEELDKEGNALDPRYVSGLGAATMTIKNASKLLTKVTVETGWAESTPEDQRVPVTVELWCDGVRMPVSTYRVTLNAENKWQFDWVDLPLFTDGTPAQYKLRESSIGDVSYDPGTDTDGYDEYDVKYYSAEYSEGTDGEKHSEATWVDKQGITHYADHVLLRSLNSLDNGLVDVNVTKQWRDGNDQDGLRPASITVKLLRNGQETGSTLTLNADNKWSGIFRGLRAYERGEQLVYTVAEVAVPGYTSTITGTAATGFNIMNTHTPETLTISGTKTWADAGNESARPEKITVILLAGGEQLAEQVVSPDANGKWSWSFENLPKYSAGKAIAYTIDELEVPGYTKKVDGYNITNTYKPAASPSPTPTATPAPTPTATTIPTDSPAPSYAPTPTAKPGSNPRTGDESNIALWAAMGLVSMAAAAGAVLLIKKRGRTK